MWYFVVVLFEVLTAVVKTGTVFWDITHYSLLKVSRRLGGPYFLRLQGLRVSHTRNEQILIVIVIIKFIHYVERQQSGLGHDTLAT
jgi:hypothetical protein